MEFKQLTAAVEAMIFASGEPAEASRLASVLELDEETVHKICARIAAELEERASGLMLVRLDNSYQLCTRTEYAGQIKALLDIRRNMPLSQAALEVLAIVAYNQPVTKAFAEQVRGVNCSSIFATLMNKGLIEERGRLELPGRPLLYGTTPNFLRCFHLTCIEDLPPLPSKTDSEDEETPEEDPEAV